jgi:hypothetical protein
MLGNTPSLLRPNHRRRLILPIFSAEHRCERFAASPPDKRDSRFLALICAAFQLELSWFLTNQKNNRLPSNR